MQRNQLVSITKNKFKAFLKKYLRKSNMFIGYIWTKLKRNAQHQSEKIPDWAIHLKYFKSILLESDTNNTLQKGQLGQIFYNGLKLLIKL